MDRRSSDAMVLLMLAGLVLLIYMALGLGAYPITHIGALSIFGWLVGAAIGKYLKK